MRTIHSIPRKRAKDFLKHETQGRIFSAYFRKKDGQMRNMVARRGVSKYATGGTMRYDPDRYGLLPVYDMEHRGYRMVNLLTLVSFNVGGETFIVE